MDARDTPTLCVQGIKDGVRRGALEAEFEAFGRLVRVDIVPGNARRGVPDSRIAFVEFERKDDARKAMQSLNGRYVQGKCVMIQFARGAPGMRCGGPPAVRRGTPEPIPQCAALAAKYRHSAGALAAKFPQPQTERSRSCSRRRPREGKAEAGGDRQRRARSSSQPERGKAPVARARSGTRGQGAQAASRPRSRSRSRRRSRQRNGARGGACSPGRSPARSRERSRGRNSSRQRSRERSRPRQARSASGRRARGRQGSASRSA